MSEPAVPRQSMDVDVACVGFGPAMGGFLSILSAAMTDSTGAPLESRAMGGMPLQVVCYERADDIGFGVSGVVTRARGIRQSFPQLNPAEIPMAAEVTDEKVLYLLDPVGASRRPITMWLADKLIRTLRFALPYEHYALELPYTPEFLHKKGGLVLSIGQFNQWVGQQIMLTGAVQIWPGSPVSEPLIEEDRVGGVRLMDQGVDRDGKPADGYMPGMDIRAALTVVADGPVGPVGRKIDEHFGLPEGHSKHEWAVGMKFVVDLPEDTDLKPGTVLHTLGYP
ncbi:MAG: 4Fe-4S ferredoxin, partial [bacterium]|nr:4Fe-4S ferredoxin [bacterium]